jgi:hypothetical protein
MAWSARSASPIGFGQGRRPDFFHLNFPPFRRERTRPGGRVLLAAVLVATTPAWSVPAALGQENDPSLLLEPTSGPAGTAVQASGAAFEGCGINLYWDSPNGPLLGSAALDGGAFSTDIAVPNDATAGEHVVVAQELSGVEFCTNPTGEQATAAFTVTDDAFLIRLMSRTFAPEPGFDIDGILEQRGGEPGDRVHFLLQFFELPNVELKRELAAAGFELLNFVTGNAYVASGFVDDLGMLPDLAEAFALRWAGPLFATDKVSGDLTEGIVPPWARLEDDRVALTVQPHGDVAIEVIEALLLELGGDSLVTAPDVPSVTALFPFSMELIEQISGNDAVQFLDVAPPALQETNDGARAAANVDVVNGAPYNLDGSGVTVLVFDSGMVDDTHPDFGARVIELDGDAAETVRDHSTHVAGTVAGSGVNSNGVDSAGTPNGGTPNQWAGMAPGANLRSFGASGSTDVLYDDAGDINADFATAIGNGIDLATMSLGNNVVPNGFPCGQLGDYTNTAILIDNIVRGSIGGQQLIWFESAGNERTGGGPCGQFSTISSPATAKNSIVVGAINSNDNSMTGFSSFGPTDDGRLKPDITAPGCQSNGDLNLTSPSFLDANGNGNLDAGEVQNAYVGKCGTSMATPVAAGSAALLIEQWQSTRGAGTRPLAHSAKAIFVHTGNDLGNAGPDYQFGWGALDAQAAVDLVQADDTANLIHVEQLDAGEDIFLTFDSDGSDDVKVTLAWDDPAASKLAAVTLINDLDLRLFDPNDIEVQPLVLNPAVPNALAVEGNDTRNNVEMALGPVMAGTWTVQVIGTTVAQGPQQFTLITPAAAEVNQPPVCDANGPYLAECAGPTTDVTLDGTGSSDPDGDPLDFIWTGPFVGGTANGATPTVAFPGLGLSDVTLEVTDDKGASDLCMAEVTIEDTTPPQLALGVSPSKLWPPNHKLIDIEVEIIVEDLCDAAPTVRLVSIISNEPANGPGDGNKAPDIQDAEFGTDDRAFKLRAERSGKGPGRIYTITYEVEDQGGNTATAEATVTVAHDRRP